MSLLNDSSDVAWAVRRVEVRTQRRKVRDSRNLVRGTY
jgi:hypothetical protein